MHPVIHLPGLALVVGLSLAFLAAGPAYGENIGPDGPVIFHTNAYRISVPQSLPLVEQLADAVAEPPSSQPRWQDLLAELRDTNPATQLERINDFINNFRYVKDERNYGEKDYWALPSQFLRKGGDCDDFAIAKYVALRHLGFPPETMRIVVVKDLSRQGRHAVLLVRLGGQFLSLDNADPLVRPAAEIFRYRAIYSVNERHYWIHKNADPAFQGGNEMIALESAQTTPASSRGASIQ